MHHKKNLHRTGGQLLLLSLTAGILFAPFPCSAGDFVGPMPQTSGQASSGAAANTAVTPAPSAGLTPVPTETPNPAISQVPTGAGPSDAAVQEGMLSPSHGSSDSIFGQTSTEGVTDEKLSTLLSTLQGSFPASNGQWAVYICDLVNNSEGSLGTENGSMQAASLIKLFIMGAVYENYDVLCQQYGQSSVDSSLYSMITVSDNDAANTLVSYLGGGDSQTGMAAVNSFCQNHGYNDTSMGRLLLQSNAYGDNYTSVADCGRFLKSVYLSGYEKSSQDFTYGESMFSLLKAQTRRNKIPAQMPEGVSVANKTGELSDVENDAGIIYDTTNDLVIVFMSENLSETGSAQTTIASLSREIYDYYN